MSAGLAILASIFHSLAIRRCDLLILFLLYLCFMSLRCCWLDLGFVHLRGRSLMDCHKVCHIILHVLCLCFRRGGCLHACRLADHFLQRRSFERASEACRNLAELLELAHRLCTVSRRDEFVMNSRILLLLHLLHGLTSTLKTPSLKKVIGETTGMKAATAAEAKAQNMKNDVAHFVAVHQTSAPKVNEAEIQPTAAKAHEAEVQEKKDEKIAAAYGKRMEHQIEAKMAKPADIRGNGAHHAPQLVQGATQNP